MSLRVNLDDIKTRLASVMTTPGVKIYTVGDRNVKLTYGKVSPAVYILRQTATTTNNGGSAKLVRQNVDIWVEIALVANKYEDGALENEQARTDLANDTFLSLIGWTLPGFTIGFDLSTSSDGDPSSVVNYCVQKWHTKALFQGVAR